MHLYISVSSGSSTAPCGTYTIMSNWIQTERYTKALNFLSDFLRAVIRHWVWITWEDRPCPHSASPNLLMIRCVTITRPHHFLSHRYNHIYLCTADTILDPYDFKHRNMTINRIDVTDTYIDWRMFYDIMYQKWNKWAIFHVARGILTCGLEYYIRFTFLLQQSY